MYIQITPFFPHESSFVGSYIYDQVNELKKQYKGDVKIFKTVSILSKEKDYCFEGITVHILKRIDFPSNILPFFFTYFNFLLFVWKLQRLNISLYDFKILHIHSFNNAFYGYCIKKKNNKSKFFIQYHGLDTFGLKMGIFKKVKLHHRYLIVKARKYLKNCDLIIGVSTKTLDYINNIKEFNSHKKYILYNGVDRDKFYIKSPKEISDTYQIGCVGNFIELKNQMMLLQALLLLRNRIKYRVTFIGTGATLEMCKKFVLDNGLSDLVIFKDRIKHDLLVDFYNSLDLFVLPSIFEALGCVYLEAHACGVPFIGIRGQGIDDFIFPNEKDYWLVEKDDVNKLARNIFLSVNRNQKLVIDYDLSSLIRKFLIDNIYEVSETQIKTI